MSAEVGDDVLGEDPTVNSLQQMLSDMFGMEGALFFPSGTMTNQVAIKIHTEPGDEVICHELSHVYRYEGGGISFNSGASVRLLKGGRGTFKAADVSAAINSPHDPHCARSRLVVIENTVNMGGGCCWSFEEIKRIRKVCDENGLMLHLDGARLFNAMVVKDESISQYGAMFDTISVCLSKGLGAPVGSVLIGSNKHMARALRFRKVMGGGMRQAGYLAAAGLYALANHVERLVQDHAHAQAFAKELDTLGFVVEVLPVETNIVIFDLVSGKLALQFLNHLEEQDVRMLRFGQKTIRAVFHLGINEQKFDKLIVAARSFQGA